MIYLQNNSEKSRKQARSLSPSRVPRPVRNSVFAECRCSVHSPIHIQLARTDAKMLASYLGITLLPETTRVENTKYMLFRTGYLKNLDFSFISIVLSSLSQKLSLSLSRCVCPLHIDCFSMPFRNPTLRLSNSALYIIEIQICPAALGVGNHRV